MPRSSHHRSRASASKYASPCVRMGVIVRLALVGHLEVRHEAGRHQVPPVLGPLVLREQPEPRVGEAEHAPGDLHESRRRPERLGQSTVGLPDPVQRLVQVSVDIDDAHANPPSLPSICPADGTRTRSARSARAPITSPMTAPSRPTSRSARLPRQPSNERPRSRHDRSTFRRARRPHPCASRCARATRSSRPMGRTLRLTAPASR